MSTPRESSTNTYMNTMSAQYHATASATPTLLDPLKIRNKRPDQQPLAAMVGTQNIVTCAMPARTR
jgi:hypothetical protein